MSLAIIIQGNTLCGELKTLIDQCQSLKPKYLVVNTLNHDLIDYFVVNYANQNLTCFPFRDIYYLLVQIKAIYRADRYLLLNTLDPGLNLKNLNHILNEFDQSNSAYGYLTNKLSRSNLISNGKMYHRISEVNSKLLYYNVKEEGVSYLPCWLTLDSSPKVKLVNQSVMITGALGGIGLATAKLYHQKGWKIIAVDRINIKDLNQEVKEIFNGGYYQLDLSRTHLSQSIREILKNIGRIDLLVHIAGIQSDHSILGTHSGTKSDWNRIFNVNVRSIYTLTRLCFNHLRKTKGTVVVISSVHAYASSDKISVYAITKSALLGLVRNFALEWGKYGIRINGIAPGAIDTPMLRDGLNRRGNPKKVFEKLKRRHIMGKIGQPEQIAESISYLGNSKKSGFMTGQTIVIDGGASILLSTEVS